MPHGPCPSLVDSCWLCCAGVLQEVVRSLLDEGMQGAARLQQEQGTAVQQYAAPGSSSGGWGLMYSWHGKRYLGAAHGEEPACIANAWGAPWVARVRSMPTHYKLYRGLSLLLLLLLQVALLRVLHDIACSALLCCLDPAVHVCAGGVCAGLCGIVYVLLHCMPQVQQLDRQAGAAGMYSAALRQAVDALAAAALPSGNLPTKLGDTQDV